MCRLYENKAVLNTLSNNCPCPPVEVVEVPGVQGSTGAAGSNGTNGINSYTATTANLIIPTTGTTVQIGVANTSWTVIGQNVFISDGTNLANFQITGIQASPPVLTLKALGYTGDTAATGTITAGAAVVPSGVQGPSAFTPIATNNAATGGSQNLSNTPAQALSVGLTLAGSAGKTYMLFARIRLDYVGATFAAQEAVTLTIRRTNNTAANIASTSVATQILTAVTYGAGELSVIAIPYTTSGTSDVIQPFVSVAATPSAGNLNVVEASISALELT